MLLATLCWYARVWGKAQEENVLVYMTKMSRTAKILELTSFHHSNVLVLLQNIKNKEVSGFASVPGKKAKVSGLRPANRFKALVP